MVKYLTVFAFVMFSTTSHADSVASLTNVFVHNENLVSAGQPSESDFAALAEDGFSLVINLSPVNLPASLANEKSLVEAAGMEYRFLPVDWNTPTIENFNDFRRILEGAGDKRVLVHCWVNARASGFVYLWQATSGAQSIEDAFDDLEKIWANNPGYEIGTVPHWQAFFETVLQDG